MSDQNGLNNSDEYAGQNRRTSGQYQRQQDQSNQYQARSAGSQQGAGRSFQAAGSARSAQAAGQARSSQAAQRQYSAGAQQRQTRTGRGTSAQATPRPRTASNPYSRQSYSQQGQRPQASSYSRNQQARPGSYRTINAHEATRANRARHSAAGNKEAASAKEAALYNDLSRYTDKRKRRLSPVVVVVAIVAVLACAFGVYNVINPPSFDITVNGAEHTVGRGSTLDSILDDGIATPTAGNLVAVDSSVITQGGGTRFTAKVNGTETSDGAWALKSGDVVEITNGSDVTEEYDATTAELPYKTQVVSDTNYWNGSLHRYIKGQNGVSTTKTGKISGKTVTEDTTPAIDEEYLVYTADTGDDKVIALTFDDGPWATTTEEILDILKQYDAKATFFTIGNQIADLEDVVKRAYSEGHEICTHTWDHAAGTGQGVNLTYMSASEQIQEVEKGFKAITDVTGAESTRVMRAPGGNFTGSIIWTLQDYIDAEIGWDIDTEDWRKPGSQSIANQILKAKSGYVILMHDGGGDRSQTVEALKIALPQLVEQGYKFVTVSDLLAYDIPESE